MPLPADHPSFTPTQESGASITPGLNRKEGETAPFYSILFDEWGADAQLERQEVPDFFRDLNLDQIVDTITIVDTISNGRREYNLKPFFYFPLKRVDTVYYRQAIFQDLENPKLVQVVRSFAEEMRGMRAHLALAEKRYYKLQKQASFLNAIETYCSAIAALKDGLVSMSPRSKGFQGLRDFLVPYAASEDFTALAAETTKIRADINNIRYSLHIQGSRVTIDRNDENADYSREVLATFERFRQADPRDHHFKAPRSYEMNHIEAEILEQVAKLYAEIFSHLDEYCTDYRGYCHEVISRFDREVQFYIGFLEQMQPIKDAGLSFCYPKVTDHSKEVQAVETYDLALANLLVSARKNVITNDFYLKEPERVFVVSGPNQGGKTTFARTFGQLHYLAALGCLVPGVSATLFLFDKLFTHFEKEEDMQNLRGKLEDDLIRINDILEKATVNSIIIMNESFLSTTLNDALFLSREVMKRIAALNLLCVTVTFLDELACFDKTTVSMVSTVNPNDPRQRTFKIIRSPADGLAYAAAIAEKYHLTYDAVKTRIGANQIEVSGS